MNDSVLVIDILSGLRTGQRVSLIGNSITMGRETGLDVAFPGETEVSMRHARLTRRGALWVLEDLQSRNGTFLRRAQGITRVAGAVVVSDGTEFLLGRVALRVRLAPAPEPAEASILRVTWANSQLRYTVNECDRDWPAAARPFTQTDRRSMERRLFSLAMLAHTEGQGGIAGQTARRILQFGDELAARVLPEPVADWFAGRAAKACPINALSEAAHIPWELLTVRGQPLCTFSNLFRTTASAGHSLPLTQARTSRNTRILIIADPQEDLPQLRGHAEQLLEVFTRAGRNIQTTYIAGRQASRLDLLRHLEQHDIVYFVGHARYEAAAPLESGWLLYDGRITAADFRLLAQVPLFVFANGCDTAREATRDPTDSAHEVRGLASAFLAAGVGAYLGTHWPVAPDVAEAVAESLCNALLQGTGLPQALRQARITAAAKLPGTVDCLAYMLCVSHPGGLPWKVLNQNF